MKIIQMAAISLFISTTTVTAADIVLGIGADDINGAEATALQFEYHTDPIREYRWGAVSGFATVQVDNDSDVFVGAGLSAISNLSQKWFVEANLALGYYDAGDQGTDLGGNLQFRSLLGVGYRLSERSRISIAIDHMSNGGIEDFNPGRETLSLRYGRSF